jgi:hypothetical protein
MHRRITRSYNCINDKREFIDKVSEMSSKSKAMKRRCPEG